MTRGRNCRDGVLMLSENTGSHQELIDYVISVMGWLGQKTEGAGGPLGGTAGTGSDAAAGHRQPAFSADGTTPPVV